MYELNKSYGMVSEEELWLRVFQEEVLLEKIPLLNPSQFHPDGKTGEVYYVPPQGWQVGTYDFQAELYDTESEGLIQATQQEHISVTYAVITHVVGWNTLGVLVGAIFIAILAIVGLILYRRRDALRELLTKT